MIPHYLINSKLDYKSNLNLKYNSILIKLSNFDQIQNMFNICIIYHIVFLKRYNIFDHF